MTFQSVERKPSLQLITTNSPLLPHFRHPNNPTQGTLNFHNEISKGKFSAPVSSNSRPRIEKTSFHNPEMADLGDPPRTHCSKLIQNCLPSFLSSLSNSTSLNAPLSPSLTRTSVSPEQSPRSNSQTSRHREKGMNDLCLNNNDIVVVYMALWFCFISVGYVAEVISSSDDTGLLHVEVYLLYHRKWCDLQLFSNGFVCTCHYIDQIRDFRGTAGMIQYGIRVQLKLLRFH